MHFKNSFVCVLYLIIGNINAEEQNKVPLSLPFYNPKQEHYSLAQDYYEIQDRAICFIKDGFKSSPSLVNSWLCHEGLPDTKRHICDWPYITCSKNQFIVDINIFGKKLVGTISSYIGQLTKLEYLVLNKNSLTGSIPSQLGNLLLLKELGLGGNALTGTIPSQLGRLTNLDNALELFGNRLVGSIPSELGQLKRVNWIMLSSNMLQGSVPNSFCNLSNLKHLQLASNPSLTCLPQCILDAPLPPLVSIKTKVYDANLGACTRKI